MAINRKNMSREMRESIAIESFQKHLTEKEKTILNCLAKGYTYKDMIEGKIAKQGEITRIIDKAKRVGVNPRKALIQEQRDKLTSYMSDFRSKSMTIEQLQKNLPEIQCLVDELGNKVTDEVFLARIYNCLGQFVRCDSIFCKIMDSSYKLTPVEQRILDVAEEECSKVQYKSGIYSLLSKNIDKDTIISETLRRIPERKNKYINLKFIVSTIKEYENLQKNGEQIEELNKKLITKDKGGK